MEEFEINLIEKSKQGDVESFEMLIKSYQTLAYNIAFRMLGNVEDASDATQEALVKVFKSIHSFQGQSSFSTWLYRIVTNTCLDELRKRKRQKVYSYHNPVEMEDGEIDRDVVDPNSSTEEIFEKKEEIKSIQDAIQALPEQHKTVIILRDIKGLSYEQISEILDCPQGTIKSRISRARLALKDIITNRELYQKPHV
ncbi:RNA polymerase sigma-70 factor (ECF subfamily) [Anaerosolibacter carboniphilus]|uniref:RNA polymerase sigma-70 factor (ECF subfamily) n=1 Tax=Anaerosolibacter carboniphilus TaxID=1417629 RepID=A0A841KMA4_9FIRM|nr:sigma-70 family RNA polymerase sigma factor [Anaerosolibacter carboniphilus]MBB6214934.1 RNA polymerase sigma-70 factor (ECF subfamily) [Anaerosolibacter carboniphilus]